MKNEKAVKSEGCLRAAAYARFSSEMQRDESIDAQLRAIQNYANQHNMLIVHEYVDRACSATTDKRPEFQEMIADAKKDAFDVVIVHKLDRFSRNRFDSAIYRRELKLAGVGLRSVLENLDDSPESKLLESMLEGLNEYYSLNLAREVEKGRKENALRGVHVGGIPPLGYIVNKETKLLEIEPFEAEAVKLIYQMYLEDNGYSAIINTLNQKGYRTKKNKPFGKNSIYEILRNEKYTGTYLYNKAVAKNANGKYNRHKYKAENEIIRVEHGCPALICKEDFQKVQEKMEKRKHQTARFKARRVYLLSGKVICGVCGCTYAGNARKPRPDHPYYASYCCTKRNGTVHCHNGEINAEKLERVILHKLAGYLFDERLLPELQKRYVDFARGRDQEGQKMLETLKIKQKEVQKGISNIVGVIMQTGSPALSEQLKNLEVQKAELDHEIQKALEELDSLSMDAEQMKIAFQKAKEMLASGELHCVKKVLEQYVDFVEIFPTHVVLHLKVKLYQDELFISREEIKEM